MQLRISLHNAHVGAYNTIFRLVTVAETSYNGLESTSSAQRGFEEMSAVGEPLPTKRGRYRRLSSHVCVRTRFLVQRTLVTVRRWIYRGIERDVFRRNSTGVSFNAR